ncbi:hypothetical protein J4573_43430 [Actinomadura barringtoniae]|uniref:histidine kinase n=1 Tax=Actinomadura barringtoniae TaxID=1427535 RepID=A0A939PPY7_9ACTN|nr:histidine kinase [Actinomadura barringtoniae]MBO2454004.1 hypothetical protein [Actinomadura barringtoniae]
MKAFGRLQMALRTGLHLALRTGLHLALRRHPFVAHAALAALLFAATMLTADGNRSVAAFLAAALAYGSLLARRHHPFLVLAAATVGAGAFIVLTGARGLAFAAPMIALYNAADTTGRRKSLIFGWLAVLGLALAHAAFRPKPFFSWENVALIALCGLALAAGDAARSRRKYIAEVEERARRAERDREDEAHRRVIEERLRIARDLHDAVGHHLALINVQAGVAEQVLSDRPDLAKAALAQIRRSGRAGLSDLSETIGLLRGPDEPTAPTQPTAGLARLEELLESLARSGLQVDRLVTGSEHRLPPAADVTAYRVVQESLTNIRKHAEGSTALVRLTYETDALRIEIENGARTAPAPTPAHPANPTSASPAAAPAITPVLAADSVPSIDARASTGIGTSHGSGAGTDTGGGHGHGIAGMRERVAALGGWMEAGPMAGGGFRVAVRLPASTETGSVS